MRKIFFLICLVCCSVASAYSQKATADDKLALIAGQWKQNGENIYVQKVIELDSLTKDVIYNKVLEFMTNTYKDANEVIQVKEKENGLLIGKGNSYFYVNDIFSGSGVKQTVWHIFKAEVKDNKVRITISIDRINWSVTASKYISAKDDEYPIITCYPIANDDTKKKRSGYVFYYAVNNIIELLNACESFLIKKAELTIDDNW